MLNRYISRDIRDKILTLLNDTSTGLNVILNTIDIERTETTPKINLITYKWGFNQIPLIIVDMEKSDTQIKESELTNSYDLLTEIYKCNIIIMSKSNTELLINHIENYIDGIIRILHGYNDSKITWIALTDIEQSDLYQKENQMMKEAVMSFEIRIN